MGISFVYPLFSADDSNGAPLVGGKLYTYVPGTTTAATTYSNRTLTTPNTNPILLNSRGEALVYAASPKKLVLTTPTGDPTSPIWSVDYVGGNTTGSFTLTAGTTTTVLNALITANSLIFLQPTNLAATVTALQPYVSALNAGVSFVITHIGAAGTETYNYMIIN